MKPFSLEEYLKNPSKKIVTRGGRKVRRILCTDAKGTYPIVALVEISKDSDDENAITYTNEGKWWKDHITDNDLFFVPEKHEGWINLYKNAMGYVFPSYIYQTEEEAKKGGRGNDSYTTTVKIEWEE